MIVLAEMKEVYDVPINADLHAPDGKLVKKETRGRPKNPETINAENSVLLIEKEAKIKELSEKLRILLTRIARNPHEEVEEMAEELRLVFRAIKGLGPEEESLFLGLTNVKDIRERSRLDEATLLSHSAMRVAAAKWPEFEMFLLIAEMEDPYYISLEGEGRKEAILTVQAKTKLDGNMILNMPNTQGGTAQTEQPQAAGPSQPQKKSMFQKVFRR